MTHDLSEFAMCVSFLDRDPLFDLTSLALEFATVPLKSGSGALANLPVQITGSVTTTCLAVFEF